MNGPTGRPLNSRMRLMASENENRKKARRLLAAYWLLSVLKGGNIPAAPLAVLKIEGGARKKAFLERHRNLERVVDRSAMPAAAAGRSAVKKGQAKGKAAGDGKAGRARSGPVHKTVFRNCLKYLIRKERLF